MSDFEFEAKASYCGPECIIAHKIFDQCRLQKCLTPCMLGPARAAAPTSACSEFYGEGEIITPPSNAASVGVRDLRLVKILILQKKESPFRRGFWDISAKFVFNYDLVFKSVEGVEICSVRATSSYTAKVTLRGGDSGDAVVASDLYGCDDALASAPFVTVEGKAVNLSAELSQGASCCDPCCCSPCNDNCNCNQLAVTSPTSVDVTIGLFAIIKIFRPINIIVESQGYCMPKECCGPSAAADPCDFFDNLDFPMEIFAPYGKPIPSKPKRNDDCPPPKGDDCRKPPKKPNNGCCSR